jgi:predicted membrane chloride channel (bestrophin family)
VAIARKLLVMVGHLLAKSEADKFANSLQVALGFFAFAHRVHTRNLPNRSVALDVLPRGKYNVCSRNQPAKITSSELPADVREPRR